jgi:hypothetical protein
MSLDEDCEQYLCIVFEKLEPDPGAEEIVNAVKRFKIDLAQASRKHAKEAIERLKNEKM